jgi:hypothetical protein
MLAAIDAPEFEKGRKNLAELKKLIASEDLPLAA